VSATATIRIIGYAVLQALSSLAVGAAVGGPDDLSARLTFTQVVAMPPGETPSLVLPARTGSDNIVRLFAAAGEFESARILVRVAADSPLKLQLRVGDLSLAETPRGIPSASIEIRVVKEWYQGSSAWNDILKDSRNDFRQKLTPELLLNDDALVEVDRTRRRNYLRVERSKGSEYVWVNQPVIYDADTPPPAEVTLVVRDSDTLQPFTLQPGEYRQLWLTVKVPAAATPGTYVGMIQATSEGTAIATIPLEVSVHPITLADPEILYSIYYRAQLVINGRPVGAELRNQEQMVADLRDIVSHGIAYPTMYQEATRLDLVREALLARREAGIRSGPLFYLGIQTTEWSLHDFGPNSSEALARIVPAINRMAREFGYSPVYFYGHDEAAGQELLDQRSLWQSVHRLGGRVFVAGSTGSYELVGDLLDVHVNYGSVNSSIARDWHSTGKKVFSYANPQSGPENPYLFRLNYGLLLWANNYDGAMPYAYQHCFGSCWNDIDFPTNRDLNMTYPTANGSIPTLAWEGFREGVDDVRYVEALQRKISSNSGDSAAVRDAVTYLKKLRGDLTSMAPSSGTYNRLADLDLDEVRRFLVQKISEIDRTSGRAVKQ